MHASQTLDYERSQSVVGEHGIYATKTSHRVIGRNERPSHRRGTLVKIVDLPSRYERIEIHPHKREGHGSALETGIGHEPRSGERAGRMRENRVRPIDQLADDRGNVGSVMLGVVRGRRNVIAGAVAAEIEQYAAILPKLARDKPPDPSMAAVPV